MTDMNRIRIVGHAAVRHPNDCQRIVSALASAGYDCTIEQAEMLWDCYSDGLAAGWIFLPDEDERIVDCVRPYFVEIETP